MTIKRFIVFLPILLLIIFFTLTSIQNSANKNGSSETKCVKCNLILISIDPFRASNIHYYGYDKQITPNIDSLAKESFVFLNAYSVSSWTLPSTMSIFTGIYPSKHKVVNKITLTKEGQEEITNLKKISPNIKTMAEILKTNGYKSAGFTGGAALHRQFGFADGFDTYVDGKDFAGLSDNLDQAIEWLNKNKKEKFFLFLQGFDLHGQFIPEGGLDFRYSDPDYKGKLTGSPDEQKELREDALFRKKLGLTKDDVEFIKSIYDEKLNRFDELVGKLINNLKNQGLLDSTVIILTSSHGEEIYEHNRLDHGHSLYQELIHIPLIISIPGTKHENIVSQISNIDLMPSILNLLNIYDYSESFQELDGENLFPLQKLKNRPVFSETDYRYAVSLKSLLDPDGWKIIKDLGNGNIELYNLNNDPQEENNIAQKEYKKINEMISALDRYSN